MHQNMEIPGQPGLNTVTLEALPVHDPVLAAKKNPLTRSVPAELALPIFSDPENWGFSEAVAVVLRNESGKPIHGGFYAQSLKGLVKLVLVDRKRGINTDANPAWTAFGLGLAVGQLKVRDADGERVLPWSIDDITLGKTSVPLNTPNPVRSAVRDAYLQDVLPAILDIH